MCLCSVEWSCCLEAPYYNIPGPTHYGTGTKCPLTMASNDKRAPGGNPTCSTRLITRTPHYTVIR